jgi:tRNA (guanine-N7-)-methyltransferase
VGIEKYSSVLLRALEKREELPDVKNLLFLRMDAEELPEVFGKDEVAGIYLNFSDPWPKDRHAKRRLPSKEFLARYDQILCPQGKVEFKTDNRDLFEFALEQAKEAKWNVEAFTFDLHHDSQMVEGNIMTEYEERFSLQGNPICKMIISR